MSRAKPTFAVSTGRGTGRNDSAAGRYRRVWSRRPRMRNGPSTNGVDGPDLIDLRYFVATELVLLRSCATALLRDCATALLRDRRREVERLHRPTVRSAVAEASSRRAVARARRVAAAVDD